MSFVKTSGTIQSLKIGRLTLIRDWLDEMDVKNYDIDENLNINANNVSLNNRHIAEFPDFIQFNKIYGWFDMGFNFFTSLKGCPIEIAETFYCWDNKISSLEYSPRKVGEGYFFGRQTRQFTTKEISDICVVGGLIISI